MKVRVLSLALIVKVFGRGAGGVLRRFLCSIEEEEEKREGTFLLLLRASMRRISMVVLAGPWRI